MKPRYPWVVFVPGLLLAGLSAWMASWGDLSAIIPKFLVGFAGLFLLYVAAVIALSRVRVAHRPTLIFIFAVALACRVALLFGPPTLSNDIYRYLWEGRVIAAGHNPFALPPDAPELETLRDENYPGINHPRLETIYPPLAQGVFWIGAAVEPDLRTQKVLFVFFDMATMVMLLLLLRSRGRNVHLCAVYGWSPLVLVEFSHSGHMDSVGIFFLVLALLLLEKRATWMGFVSLALSFLAKYLAALLVPFFLFKKKYIPWLLLFGAVAVAGYLPFAGAGSGLVSSLRTYGTRWEFNSLLFSVLKRVFGDPDRIHLVLFACVGAYALLQGYARKDPVKFAYRVIACSLLLSPTVYPWYIVWIVPFLCFYSSRAWLFFSGAVAASYWVWVGYPQTGVWEVGWVPLLLQYVPFYALLGHEAWRGARSKSARLRESS